MLLKIIALGPKQYLTNQWNVFDGFVVVVSMLEMILHYSQVLPTRSLSVIRTFRLVSKNHKYDSSKTSYRYCLVNSLEY